MAKLTTYVHVADEHGAMHVFGPDDEVPAWAAKAITNPDVWDGAELSPSPTHPVVEDGPPPKGGAGSGAPAWREYAAKRNVEVPENASREDVVAALEAANVPTE